MGECLDAERGDYARRASALSDAGTEHSMYLWSIETWEEIVRRVQPTALGTASTASSSSSAATIAASAADPAQLAVRLFQWSNQRCTPIALDWLVRQVYSQAPADDKSESKEWGPMRAITAELELVLVLVIKQVDSRASSGAPWCSHWVPMVETCLSNLAFLSTCSADALNYMSYHFKTSSTQPSRQLAHVWGRSMLRWIASRPALQSRASADAQSRPETEQVFEPRVSNTTLDQLAKAYMESYQSVQATLESMPADLVDLALRF
jgi:hypothetical protein